MAQQAPLPSKTILFILCIAILGCTRPIEKSVTFSGLLLNSADKRITNENGSIFFNKQPFNGILYTLYPTTADTATISSYLNGKEDGEWKKFYRGGRLNEQREFKSGKKTGKLLSWWPNGNKQFHYLFMNDEYEGTCREWNEEGKLTKEMNYSKGHEEGLQRWWYDNGKIKANYIIKEGRRYGLLGTKNCINVSDSIFKD